MIRKCFIRLTDVNYTADPELPTLAEFGGYKNGDVIEAEIHDDLIAVAENPDEGTFHLSPREYEFLSEVGSE